MEMDQFRFGIILFLGQILSSAADCSTNIPDVHAFGKECQYMCHCKNGDNCDTNTGECSEACATNRFGPACQYRDLAEAQFSRHRSNQNPEHYSGEANDGDTSTCSRTQGAQVSPDIPWWRVWFLQNETIRDIYILTEDTHLKYFRSFNVTVEYVPENKKNNNSYVPTNVQTCYQHSNTIPERRYIQVHCDQPLVGNQVRIKLSSVQSQLVLCDVRIGAGRNIAFRKYTTSNGYTNNYSPDNAVDGRFGSASLTDWTGCFAASDAGNYKYLDINLGTSTYTYSVNIDAKSEEYIRDYKIYTSPTSQEELQLLYDDTGNIPPVTYVHIDANVQQLRIQTNSANQLGICELQIYGDCSANKCGYDCSENCYCNSNEDYEHRISGVCTTGCQERWTGANGKCNIECDESKWGTQCQNDCGACRVGTCDVVSGECTGGCQDGYQDATECITECDDGTYGIGCTQECVPRCANTCDKVTGHCLQCPSGWKGDFCETECSIGQYGINCAGSCGFCTVHTSCDTVTGVCPSGCMDGYTGATCKQDIKQSLQSTTIGIIAGSVVAGIVVICVTIVVLYRRRQSPPVITEPENRVEMSHAPTSASYEDLQQNVYMNDKDDTNYETINPE